MTHWQKTRSKIMRPHIIFPFTLLPTNQWPPKNREIQSNIFSFSLARCRFVWNCCRWQAFFINKFHKTFKNETQYTFAFLDMRCMKYFWWTTIHYDGFHPKYMRKKDIWHFLHLQNKKDLCQSPMFTLSCPQSEFLFYQNLVFVYFIIFTLLFPQNQFLTWWMDIY